MRARLIGIAGRIVAASAWAAPKNEGDPFDGQKALPFKNAKGDVFRLPQTMAGDFGAPEPVFR